MIKESGIQKYSSINIFDTFAEHGRGSDMTKKTLIIIRHNFVKWYTVAVQGTVVPSIISLTSSLIGQLVKSFMTIKPNTLNIFVEKREAFALSTKNVGIFAKLTSENLTKRLTNDVVSFEQPAPED